MVLDWRCLEDLEEKDDWINEWMSDEGVCRTAPATPGLSNMQVNSGRAEAVAWITFESHLLTFYTKYLLYGFFMFY